MSDVDFFAGWCGIVRPLCERLVIAGVSMVDARRVLTASPLCSWAQGLVCTPTCRQSCADIIRQWETEFLRVHQARESDAALVALAGGALSPFHFSLADAERAWQNALSKREGPLPRWGRDDASEDRKGVGLDSCNGGA